MKGHHFTSTVSNPDLPAACHSHNPTRSLSRNAGLLVSYTNCQTPLLTTFATNLKQHTNLSSNRVRPPDSSSVNPSLFHPRPSGTYNLFNLFYSTAEEGHIAGPKASLLFPIYLLSAGPTMQTSCLGNCCSVSPSYSLSYAFPGFRYYVTGI